jgi:gamma-glutamyl hydrolase
VFENDEGLREFWDVTSVSYMPDGRPFVASIEAKNYPIFATQFHPEKASTVFYYSGDEVNHSWESIELMSHFSKLMMKMARNNDNTFGDFSETQPHLIQNYDMINTQTIFQDVYVF